MTNWPLTQGMPVFEQAGINTGSTSATSVTSGGTANTKGSFSQIIASTDFDAHGFYLYLRGSTVFDTQLFDIAVGAAASEQIIVENLLIANSDASAYARHLFFPISIPSGTRISARSQSNSASRVNEIAIMLVSRGFLPSAPLGRAKCYGFNLSITEGIKITDPASLNTKGSYFELTSSTDFEIKMLYVIFTGTDASGRANVDYLVDISVGAASSEQVIIPDSGMRSEGGGDTLDPLIQGPFFVNIPPSTRLATRAQFSNTSSGAEIEVQVVGFG